MHVSQKKNSFVRLQPYEIRWPTLELKTQRSIQVSGKIHQKMSEYEKSQIILVSLQS